MVQILNEYELYKFMEFIMFALYLIFIFLSIQIFFLWKDLNKTELKVKSFINDSFFKKNSIYVFSFSVFFMLHEILEGTSLPYAMLYFEFLEMVGLLCLVIFAHAWYRALKACVKKKTIPRELINLKTI